MYPLAALLAYSLLNAPAPVPHEFPADPDEALPVCPGTAHLSAEPFVTFPSWWASGATWRLDRLHLN